MYSRYIESRRYIGKRISVFGESHIDEIATKYNLKVLGKVPIDPKIASAVDSGNIEELEGEWLDELATYLKENVKPREVENKKVELIWISVNSENK